MFLRLRALLNTLASVTVLVVLTGCSTLSPYSQITKLNLTLTASDQVNPDLNGRPSPIVVRLFELKHPVAFENADFFGVYERAKQSLATDMVATEELELRPGETVTLRLGMQGDNHYIGVLAAYRDLLDSRWRYTLQLAAQAVTDVDLTLDQNGIRPTHASSASTGNRP